MEIGSLFANGTETEFVFLTSGAQIPEELDSLTCDGHPGKVAFSHKGDVSRS